MASKARPEPDPVALRSPQGDPRPPGSEKLSADARYRVRQGDYRIPYTVDDGAAIVEVAKIGNRREVYR